MRQSIYRGKQCAGGCGYLLRCANDRSAPGTTRHIRHGYCHTCLKRLKNAPMDEQKAAQVAPGLAHLLNAREARKAKQERIEKARAYEYARWLHYRKTTMKEN